MSLNLSNLVFTSADYKLSLAIPGAPPVPLNTVESFDYSRKVEGEAVHAIGAIEPIAVKTNTAMYEGKISIQAGELNVFLLANGLLFASQIINATIAIIGGTELVLAYKGVAITTHDGSIKVKDKQSLITLNFIAQGVQGI